MDTIAAISTGSQIAAIGVLRVSGPEAFAVAEAVFRPADGRPLSAHPRRTMVYGALLDEHGGPICVESFDPLIVRWFRRHAPDILRGQLTSQASDLGASPLAGFALSRLLTNFLCRPHFIAHHIGRRSFPVWLCRRMGAMQVCWTAQDRSWEKKNDAVIFEYGTPPAQYR